MFNLSLINISSHCMNDKITLEWTELVKINDLGNLSDYSGVYLWGFQIQDSFIPYYVGIADSVVYRITEHLNCLVGGKYTIYHKDYLSQFAKYKYEKVDPDLKSGKIYEPQWPNNYFEFIEKRACLDLHIVYMLDTFAFSYAPVQSNPGNINRLKEIEKGCINQIGLQNLANTRGGHSDLLVINHSGDLLISEIFNKTNR